MTLEFGVTDVTDVWTVEAGSHLRIKPNVRKKSPALDSR